MSSSTIDDKISVILASGDEYLQRFGPRRLTTTKVILKISILQGYDLEDI